METRIFVSDERPATATSKLIGGNVWLEFDQGGDRMAICLPARMDAAARMIVEAFNSHLMGGPITRAAQTGLVPDIKSASGFRVGFPSGGAAIAIVAANLATEPGDTIELPTGDGPIDLAAARAIERRDSP